MPCKLCNQPASFHICGACASQQEHFLNPKAKWKHDGFELRLLHYCDHASHFTSHYFSMNNVDFFCAKHFEVPNSRYYMYHLESKKTMIINPNTVQAKQIEFSFVQSDLKQRNLEVVSLNDRVTIVDMVTGVESYTGQLQNSQRCGIGVVTLQKHASIVSYTAEFESNKPIGSIKVKYKNGSVYEGPINNQLARHGTGKFTIADLTYTCEWENDKPKKGTLLRYSDGDVYNGELAAYSVGVWYPHGNGTMKYKNGIHS